MLGIWSLVFPLHTAALQRARCLAYEIELRQIDSSRTALSAAKYADEFSAAAKTMSELSVTTLLLSVILVVVGFTGVWSSRTIVQTSKGPLSGKC